MIKRLARGIANVLLWIAAAIGVGCGALWLANFAGLVQPLVVISGSMEPAIMTGDLLFATRVAVVDVIPGEVVTLPSTQTGKLVTHRVVSITEVDRGHDIVMKGDANEYEDGEVYRVPAGGSVWRPALTVPGAGRTVMAMATPGVAIPLLVTLVALIGLSLLPGDPEPEDDDEPESDEPDPEPIPSEAGAAD